VKVKAPEARSKVMLGASPVAVRFMPSVGTSGSLAETVKLRAVPTVADWAAGTVMVGESVGSTTVMITIAWLDSTPSVTVNVTVKVPGA
jgi:hypothetical protein